MIIGYLVLGFLVFCGLYRIVIYYRLNYVLNMDLSIHKNRKKAARIVYGKVLKKYKNLKVIYHVVPGEKPQKVWNMSGVLDGVAWCLDIRDNGDEPKVIVMKHCDVYVHKKGISWYCEGKDDGC